MAGFLIKVYDLVWNQSQTADRGSPGVPHCLAQRWPHILFLYKIKLPFTNPAGGATGSLKGFTNWTKIYRVKSRRRQFTLQWIVAQTAQVSC